MDTSKAAQLVLDDGSVFPGISFGADKSVSGEVVFNTGMTGYPESFTDPSYRGQILVLTYPLIGNYGVPGIDKEHNLLKFFESDKVHIRALIISDYSNNHNHWNSRKSLAAWLQEHNIPALHGIDTRSLTQKLREKGVMLGKLVNGTDVRLEDPNKRNLVDEVSIERKQIYEAGKKRVLLIDCGVKYSIIRNLLARNVTVIRVPWDYDYSRERYDGIVISNGPGDPKMCKATIENVRQSIKEKIPILGICLGNQILALAAGANTYKLKYGHRSQNQPCIDLETGRCYITSQNHGYAVDTKSLGKDWKPWFVNANDNTNEGMRHKRLPFMSCQFHPEAYPGPVDTNFIFDRFLRMVK
ncbi:glutamine-hydrolyzing carbamoyl-phosphate synthase small subunit [Candidatus Woesearchaeota archaeon]|nr:glutamine-hydrolyzing carbamoyl-phosphate synthase small subunit [Candidatus Woesearchaeota archaeon]